MRHLEDMINCSINTSKTDVEFDTMEFLNVRNEVKNETFNDSSNSYMLIHYADDVDNPLLIDQSFYDFEDVKSVKYSNIAYVEMWMPYQNGGGLDVVYFNTKQSLKKVMTWIDKEIESRAKAGEHYIKYSKKLKDFLGQ